MITLRPGKKEDVPQVFQLIKELAIYEDGLDQMHTSIEQMQKDGFGEQPLYHFIVAENEGKIIGSALYYFRYSTWKGKRLYLEDLIVTEPMRGQGAGKQLFDEIIQIAKKTHCTGMMWQVLDWNEPAIHFYEKYKANFDNSWVNCNLDF